MKANLGCGRIIFGIFIAAAALAAAVSFTGRSAAPEPSPAAVQIKNFAFAPAAISIAPGRSVVWTNADAAAHTATGDDGKWDTGNLDPGKSSKPVAFSKPGAYTYGCAYHPSMKGKVIVAEPGVPASKEAPATPAPAPTYNSGY